MKGQYPNVNGWRSGMENRMFVFIRVIIAVALFAFLVQQARVVRQLEDDGEGPTIIVRVFNAWGKATILSTNPRIPDIGLEINAFCPDGVNGVGGRIAVIDSFPARIAVEVVDAGGIWFVAINPNGHGKVDAYSDNLTSQKFKRGSSYIDWFMYQGAEDIAYRRRVFSYDFYSGDGIVTQGGKVTAKDYFGNVSEFEIPLIISPDKFCPVAMRVTS